MSYQFVQTNVLLPRFPLFPFSGIRDLWCGKGDDAGAYAFARDSVWVISKQLCFSIKFGDEILTPTYSAINGFMAWTGTNHCFYRSRSHEFIFMPSSKLGYEPESDSDGFFTVDLLDAAVAQEITATGQGTAEGQTVPVSFPWPCWESPSQFGKYTDPSGAEPPRLFGSPCWRCEGDLYSRTAEPVDGYYRYGAVHFEGGVWCIGHPGSPAGWWEGEEPRAPNEAMFTFCRNPGSDATGENKVLSFIGYRLGSDSRKVYLGEVGIWR